VGQPFPHAAYLDQLAALRDQLKAGLSGAAPEEGTEGKPAVSALAEQIKGLKAAHTIEATPERTGKRATSAEEPVTARIRRRSETISTGDRENEPLTCESPTDTTLLPESEAPTNPGPVLPPGAANDDISTVHHVRLDPASIAQERIGRSR
jgi:hypothetical protein